MKMQELLIFVLILASGAYVFLGATDKTAAVEGCEIHQKGGGGTVNYSGPDGCTLEFNAFNTKGAKDVVALCSSSSTNYPCGESYDDTGTDGCTDNYEDGSGLCLKKAFDNNDITIDDLVYNEDTNKDPNGDNYDESSNSSGTQGNGEREEGENFEDTNRDNSWTPSLMIFSWWQEVTVKGKKIKTGLDGNENEPWKLSYSNATDGRVTIGLDVTDLYATSMNGETSSDTHSWSYKFNRKKVEDPTIELSETVEIKAN